MQSFPIVILRKKIVSSVIMDINLLPDELWTEIFSKMTAKERKPIRIACRRWKNCCNRPQIQKMEKLHLLGVNNFEDIVETIKTIERSIFNLKISNHRLDSFDSDAWWQWVCQAEKLELENCVIADSFMERILTCSEKLSHLTLRNVHIMMNSNRENPLNADKFGKFFIKLNELNSVATRVKTLVINCGKMLDLNEMKSLVSVFRNVVDLEFSFQHYRPCFLNGPVNDVDICEKLIKHMAAKLPQLETLLMNLQMPPFDCKCEKFLHEVNFSRLKTFRFYNNRSAFDYPFSETEIYIPRYYSFITSSHSQHLICVKFSCNAKAEDIMDVLNNHTSLRMVYIKLTSVKDCFEFIEFCKALANSKLASINIDMQLKPDWIWSLPQILDDRSLPVNSTVEELVITCEHEEDIFLSIFLKCFSSLNRLKFYSVANKNSNFANIFSQANLKCVELRSNQSWNLGNNKIEISTLKSTTLDKLIVENLEYLCIETEILKNMLLQQPSIFFSNLRRLYITKPGNSRMSQDPLPLTKEDLRCLPLYNLEEVYMSAHSCICNVFTFFSNPLDFPRIQYIGIRLSGINSIRHSQQWFQSWFKFCPSLKTIFLAHENAGICLCYDPIKGQIQEFKTVIYDANTPLMFRYYHTSESWYKDKIWFNTSGNFVH